MVKILVQFGQGFDWASLGFSNAEQFGFTVPRGCTGADLKQQISDLCGGALQPGHFRLRFVDSNSELVDCEDGALANTSNFQPKLLTLAKHGVKSGSVLVVDVLLSQDEAAMYAPDVEVEDVDVEMEGGLDQPPAQGVSEDDATEFASPGWEFASAGVRAPLTGDAVGTPGAIAPTEDSDTDSNFSMHSAEEGDEEEAAEESDEGDEDDMLGLRAIVKVRRKPQRGAAAAAAMAAAAPAAAAAAPAWAAVGAIVRRGVAKPSLLQLPGRRAQQQQRELRQSPPQQLYLRQREERRQLQLQGQEHALVRYGAHGTVSGGSSDSFQPNPEAVRPAKKARRTLVYWTVEEVERLVHGVEVHGTTMWKKIAEEFCTRTQNGRVVRQKWSNLVVVSKRKWQETRGPPLPKSLCDRIDTLARKDDA